MSVPSQAIGISRVLEELLNEESNMMATADRTRTRTFPAENQELEGLDSLIFLLLTA